MTAGDRGRDGRSPSSAFRCAGATSCSATRATRRRVGSPTWRRAGVTSRCASIRARCASGSPDGTPFDLLAAAAVPGPPGRARGRGRWRLAGDAPSVAGRVCAVRKSDTAVGRAHAKAAPQGEQVGQAGSSRRPSSMPSASSCSTTFPASGFEAAAVLDWYRIRWQVATRLQALQVPGEAGAPAEARRRESPRPGSTASCSQRCSWRS